MSRSPEGVRLRAISPLGHQSHSTAEVAARIAVQSSRGLTLAKFDVSVLRNVSFPSATVLGRRIIVESSFSDIGYWKGAKPYRQSKGHPVVQCATACLRMAQQGLPSEGAKPEIQWVLMQIVDILGFEMRVSRPVSPPKSAPPVKSRLIPSQADLSEAPRSYAAAGRAFILRRCW
jgi:hypothetical protein